MKYVEKIIVNEQRKTCTTPSPVSISHVFKPIDSLIFVQAQAAVVRATYGKERRRKMAAAAAACSYALNSTAQQTAREKAKKKKDNR